MVLSPFSAVNIPETTVHDALLQTFKTNADKTCLVICYYSNLFIMNIDLRLICFMLNRSITGLVYSILNSKSVRAYNNDKEAQSHELRARHSYMNINNETAMF